MTSPLYALKGLTVTEVVEIHDYVQLHFGDAIGISIYNEIEVSPSAVALTEFIGKTIDAVAEHDAEIEFTFIGGNKIKIRMHPGAYQGPEALELNRRGQPPVIWN
jgi:hypothetical protein